LLRTTNIFATGSVFGGTGSSLAARDLVEITLVVLHELNPINVTTKTVSKNKETFVNLMPGEFYFWEGKDKSFFKIMQDINIWLFKNV
jgi:hypothetical protein